MVVVMTLSEMMIMMSRRWTKRTKNEEEMEQEEADNWNSAAVDIELSSHPKGPKDS